MLLVGIREAALKFARKHDPAALFSAEIQAVKFPGLLRPADDMDRVALFAGAFDPKMCARPIELSGRPACVA